jgi:hypothetical protein
MKTFGNDKDGLTAQDYLIIFTSLVYICIIIPIIVCILYTPLKYPQHILTFLLDITETVAWSYGTIVGFFFLGNSGILTFKRKSPINVTTVIDESKKVSEE